MTREAPKLHDDDRVTVTDVKDRFYGEHGFIDGWHYGMGTGIIYHVWLDGRGELEPFTEEQLELGERVYA